MSHPYTFAKRKLGHTTYVTYLFQMLKILFFHTNRENGISILEWNSCIYGCKWSLITIIVALKFTARNLKFKIFSATMFIESQTVYDIDKVCTYNYRVDFMLSQTMYYIHLTKQEVVSKLIQDVQLNLEHRQNFHKQDICHCLLYKQFKFRNSRCKQLRN